MHACMLIVCLGTSRWPADRRQRLLVFPRETVSIIIGTIGRQPCRCASSSHPHGDNQYICCACITSAAIQWHSPPAIGEPAQPLLTLYHASKQISNGDSAAGGMQCKSNQVRSCLSRITIRARDNCTSRAMVGRIWTCVRLVNR
jgi:hypothetical protein